MAAPFVYVGTWTIKPGKFEEAKKFLRAHADFVETNEPRLIAFNVYFNEEGNTASVVQVHPDSESMEFHMELLAKHMGEAMSIIDRILTEQYFGPMSDSLQKTLAQWEDPGVTVVKMPVHEAGFIRSAVR